MLIEVEYLTDELKKLVSRGAGIERLPVFPTLRRVCGIEDGVKLTYKQAGNQMRVALEKHIGAITGTATFNGRIIPAETLRECFLSLLKLDGKDLNVIGRRYDVMILLGVVASEQTWRRNPECERAFLYILAEILWIKGQPDYQISRSQPA